MIYDVIIIGAGAAGLFCGATFSHNVNGIILEKTKKPATKLLMSGSGQCNITHGGSIKNFINHYGDNGSKIRSCLYKNSNSILIDFFEKNNVPLFQRKDGKIFPKSLNSKDVSEMLLKKTIENGFSILTEQNVISIKKHINGYAISTYSACFYSKKVVIATGGKSYKSTGSDGDFFNILHRDLSFEIVDLKPSLVPVFVQNYPFYEISGISFENISLQHFRNNKKLKEFTGDLLITHKNFSGPLILNFSRYVGVGDEIVINYLYPLNFKEIMDKLNNVTKSTNKDLANILSLEFNLPKRFCQIITKSANFKLRETAKILSGQKFSVSGVAGFDYAMCTSGGVSLKEINIQTMESIRYPGLFLIGEVLDIDGDTGGYNLQFAFSSAKAANKNL